MRSRARAVRPERLAGWWINRDSIFMRRPVAVAPLQLEPSRPVCARTLSVVACQCRCPCRCPCQDQFGPRTWASTSNSNRRRERRSVLSNLPRRTLLTPPPGSTFNSMLTVKSLETPAGHLTSTERKKVHRGWGQRKPPSPVFIRNTYIRQALSVSLFPTMEDL